MNRLNEEIKRSNEGDSSAGTRAAHHNDPTTRALMGRHRANPPSRLRRFT